MISLILKIWQQSDQPLRHPWHPYVDRTESKKMIFPKSNGSDIQRLSIWLVRPGNQVLRISSHR